MNVSIVIPIYNGKALLEKNLPLVLESARADDEVILVDDASTDGTSGYLVSLFALRSIECPTGVDTEMVCYSGVAKGITIKLLESKQNRRFGATCNMGVVAAKNPIIVLLNTDVAPTKDFLVHLVDHFEDSQVFGVGCKEIATMQGNQENGRSGGRFERGFFIHFREEDQNKTDTYWVAGGSGAFSREKWLLLHGFDPDFYPAYWEDIDLSVRAVKKGWTIRFEPRSIVYHNHEATNSAVFGSTAMQTMAFKNQFLFTWKHASAGELLQHFFWLPYHLIVTNSKTDGKLFSGFLQAIWYRTGRKIARFFSKN